MKKKIPKVVCNGRYKNADALKRAIICERAAELQYYKEQIEDQQALLEENNRKIESQKNELESQKMELESQKMELRQKDERIISVMKALYMDGKTKEELASLFQMTLDEISYIIG